MTFNTALSGLQAANQDLAVTGNNIANASTSGFKESRIEFSDVYASSVLGTGSDAVGSGVLIANVAQQFTQGTVAFTERSLDLAVNGNGFFVLSDAGATSYSRAGAFSIDNQGYIVSNSGANLQGYGANAQGIVTGVLTDLRIQTAEQDPSQTTAIDLSFNVDASEPVLADRVFTSFTSGAAISVPQVAGAGGSTDNGYAVGDLQVIDDTGTVIRDFDIDGTGVVDPGPGDLATASEIANYLNMEDGVSAQATTTVRLEFLAIDPGGVGSGDLLLNGNQLTGVNAAEIAAQIRTLPNFDATYDAGTGQITVVNTVGDDLDFDMTGAAGTTTQLQIEGVLTGPATTGFTGPVTIDGNTAGTQMATIGGEVFITLDFPLQLQNSPVSGNIFPASPINDFSETNTFDPTDQATYNHATSMTIYDSLGNPHILTQYFVKEAAVAGTLPNTWSMYLLIDGENIGVDDVNGDPQLARYTIHFNSDGSFDPALSQDIVVTNWTPLDQSGNYNGALGPDAALNTSNAILSQQAPTSSNFFLDVAGATQFGSAFAVTNLSQDGYASGQLAGVEISDTGVILARFTNGQSTLLGQVVLSSFTNDQGLSPVGESQWVESFASGPPIVGEAQTGNLGAIQSGALEDSNVDLSEQLVRLIIAQRNFQANAKTIETANQITQTIINLR